MFSQGAQRQYNVSSTTGDSILNSQSNTHAVIMQQYRKRFNVKRESQTQPSSPTAMAKKDLINASPEKIQLVSMAGKFAPLPHLDLNKKY